MPLIEVKLYDARVTDEPCRRSSRALTNALAESSGASREHIWVLVEGVFPKYWGVGGKPSA
jgi:4-oxalocrotonate tautomerase family enzyme